MTRSYIDSRTGDLVYRLKNKGVGTLLLRRKLVARCHICFTAEEELFRCQHCYTLACPEHYNPWHQVCTDCVQYYQHREEEASGK